MIKILLKIIKKAINIIERKLYPFKTIPRGYTSYSQCSEDLIVRYIFNLRGISKPTYLDIGANDPFYISIYRIILCKWK